MAISWNEIKDRAVRFSKDWENASKEKSEAQGFLIDLFKVFGVSQRKVGTFERDVLKNDGSVGLIDMLWEGIILVEMKSRGKDLDKAYLQARQYEKALPQHELPKFILISDFENFHLYDHDEDEYHEFKLENLADNVHLFSELAGYDKVEDAEKSEVDIKATEKMAQIHDYLTEVGYVGHQLEVFLVRLVFCMFADDSVLFNKNIFTEFIKYHTREDGSDLGARLIELFNVLNTPRDKRLKNLDESLEVFEYVNGKLFEEQLQFPYFNTKMRDLLLESCELDWSHVSPAIFGSMFQNVIDQDLRRSLGAHFTSEKNILRLIRPLFLDRLWDEFESVKHSNSKLKAFHDKIAGLRFLDPACGCGNFLVVTYRELRKLELEILKILYKGKPQIDIDNIVLLNVDSFSGIEIEEFPAKVAELALWLTDHQMNVAVSKEFGKYWRRLPLRKKANIVNGNALRIDWEELSDKPFDYILGNPPFVGFYLQNSDQKEDMDIVFYDYKNHGMLDYVSSWYVKASEYIKGTRTKVAFVSTNSIVQGEQVGFLWSYLITKFGLKIHFAHRTFRWNNEARGRAAVYCVIIGFADFDTDDKKIYEYEDINGEPHETKAKNINPYLTDGKTILINSRSKPICGVPEIIVGNLAYDFGFLTFSNKQKEEFLENEPKAKKFMKRLIGGKEFLNNEKKWCLWLVDARPVEIRSMPLVLDRIKMVKKARMESSAKSTRKLASTPSLFRDRKYPKSFVLIPRTSSENRKYIPLGYFDRNNIVGDSCLAVKNANMFHLGVLFSYMHMIWVNYTCGRLENRFRYSKDIVYNNFPWPENPTEKQKQAIEEAALAVLDARDQFPDSSLADLYDPLTMPPVLVKAHQKLDKAVDRAYRSQPFPNEAKRMEFLFDLYDKYTIGLVAEKKKGRKK